MAAPGGYGRSASSYGSSGGMAHQLAQRMTRRTQSAQVKPRGQNRPPRVAFPASLLNSEPNREPNRASVTRHYQSMLGQMSGMTRRGRPLR